MNLHSISQKSSSEETKFSDKLVKYYMNEFFLNNFFAVFPLIDRNRFAYCNELVNLSF